MKDSYTFSVKLTIAVSMIYLRSKSVVYRIIQSLANELFNVKKNLSNTTMSDICYTQVLNYNLRSQREFFRNTVNATKFSLNSLMYFI